MKLLQRRSCELLVTQDARVLARCLDALDEAGIRHKVKSVAMGHNTRRQGTISAIGESALISTLYYVYVAKCDLDSAAMAFQAKNGA